MIRRLIPVALVALLVAPIVLAKSAGHDQNTEEPELHEIDSGQTWTLYEQIDLAKGASVGDPGNKTFVAFAPPAVEELQALLILTAAQAQEIRDDLEAEGKDYRQVGDLYVIDLDAAREAAEKYSHLSQAEIKRLPKRCFGWDDKTYSDAWELNHEDELEIVDVDTEHFQGKVSADFFVAGMVSATINYEVKETACVPITFRLNDASLLGSLDLGGSIEASAALEYTEQWNWSRNLFTIPLGSFRVGGLPVRVKFELPVDLGIDTQVVVAGQAGLRADFSGSGTFDVVCTSSDCEGPSDFDYSFDIDDPEYELTLDAKARVWARAAVRAEIIDDEIGEASVGATGFAEARLFAYVGNLCGDADGDGVGDTLEDVWVDINTGYNVDARVDGLIFSQREWILFERLHHLYFRDLWDDPQGYNLSDPIVLGPRAGLPGETLRYEITTRPCYPFTDAVEFQWTGLTTDSGSFIPGGDELMTSAVPDTGDYTLEVTLVRDAHGRDFNTTIALPVSVSDTDGGDGGVGSGGDSQLTNGIARQGLSGDGGGETFFTFEVPVGATELTFTTVGGNGDADLYIRRDATPSTKSWDCRSISSTNNETCYLESPEVGTYHVLIYGYRAYSGISLKASYKASSIVGPCGDSGKPEILAASTGQQLHYVFEVEDCTTTVTFQLSGGSGDADLYVSRSTQPDRSTFDCRSWNGDNNENCTFDPAKPGKYYVMVYAYSTFEGATFEARFK